ncbi:MAG: sigma 54-interacting transcriptional regulator [Pseudomonadota bacterium]
MTDQDNTLTTQLYEKDFARPGAMLGLTILWHPVSSRIGQQHLGPAGVGEMSVGRFAPLFSTPGKEGEPLANRGTSRAPLRILRRADNSVDIIPSESQMPLEIHGEPVNGTVRLDAAEISAGVVLGLGGQVLLCLHWMSGFPKANGLPGMLGVSNSIIETRDLIRQVASTDLAVLLLGETGTGKDVAAHAIHEVSLRRALPMVAVNMATLNEAQAVPDLFGTGEDPATGTRARPGFFAEAGAGTLFLDELGSTPAAVQPMLLRVLETRRYRSLGGDRDLLTNARLIGATDQDLVSRRFNQPLLRRMEAFVIRIAPLRERREDIGILLLHSLQACGVNPDELAAFPISLVSDMCNYDWPGNIRQLANVTRRAIMAQRAGQRASLALFVHAHTAPSAAPAPAPRLATVPVLGARRKLTEVSAADLMAALEENGWRISGAAQRLGISRPSLYKLIEATPAIRPAAAIARAEIETALRANGGDVFLCAAQLKTPSEALRRHLRILGLEAQASA